MLIFYKMKPLLLLSLLLKLLGCQQSHSTSSVSLATPIIERQSERAASAQLSQPVLPARPGAGAAIGASASANVADAPSPSRWEG
jgi:hypothetical protein